jgi:hypothetical protein
MLVHIYLSNPPAKANVLHATMITPLQVSPSNLKVERNIISITKTFMILVSRLLMLEMGEFGRGKDDSGVPIVCVCVPMQQNASARQ